MNKLFNLMLVKNDIYTLNGKFTGEINQQTEWI